MYPYISITRTKVNYVNVFSNAKITYFHYRTISFISPMNQFYLKYFEQYTAFNFIINIGKILFIIFLHKIITPLFTNIRYFSFL
jgi:hypothetical protein